MVVLHAFAKIFFSNGNPVEVEMGTRAISISNVLSTIAFHIHNNTRLTHSLSRNNGPSCFHYF